MRNVLLFCGLAMLASGPAHASDLFGGVFAHDVDSPLTKGGLERGADFQLGWRGDPIRTLSFIGAPSPYVFGSLHTKGDTHFAAAGISWKIGGRCSSALGSGSPFIREEAAVWRTALEPILALACCSRPNSASAIRPVSAWRLRPAGSISVTRSCLAARIRGWTA